MGGHGIDQDMGRRRDTVSSPRHIAVYDHGHEHRDEVDRWMNMTPGPAPTASPGMMNNVNEWSHPSNQNHSAYPNQTRHGLGSTHGQTLSPATAPGSTKSPMTIGFPALDDIITLDHVRHLISLFFVHVSRSLKVS